MITFVIVVPSKYAKIIQTVIMQMSLLINHSYIWNIVIDGDEVWPGLLSIVRHDVRDPEQAWLNPQHGNAIPVFRIPL